MKLALYKAAEGSLLDKAVDIGSGLYGSSHCEIVFDHINSDADGQSLCFSASPREGKCRFKWIDLNSGSWYVIDLNDQFEWEDKMMAFQEAKFLNGRKYDYYGIFFWYILPIKREKTNRWWCSEVVAKLLGWVKYRVTPNKLARKYGAPRGEFKFSFIWKKVY